MGIARAQTLSGHSGQRKRDKKQKYDAEGQGHDPGKEKEKTA
jgi:hypothetical protein